MNWLRVYDLTFKNDILHFEKEYEPSIFKSKISIQYKKSDLRHSEIVLYTSFVFWICMLTFDSPRHAQPSHTSIMLKPHQLAMLANAVAQEKKNASISILADLPGSGKTYVLLALIHEYTNVTKNETNIVVVPQNIYTQWSNSIDAWNATVPAEHALTYKSYMNYSEITSLYFSPLKDAPHILLTTPIYWSIISDAMASANATLRRVIVDEIDSVSDFLAKQIKCRSLWLVSATFDKRALEWTPYKTIANNIKCTVCDPEFVKRSFDLPPYSMTTIVCKDMYVNLLHGLISDPEMLKINALVIVAKDALDFFVTELKKTIVEHEENIPVLEKSLAQCEIDQKHMQSASSYIHTLSMTMPMIKKIVDECPPEYYDGLRLFLKRYGYKHIDDIPIDFPLDLPKFNAMVDEVLGQNPVLKLSEQLENSKKNLIETREKYKNICQRLNDASTCLICYVPFDEKNIKCISVCCQNTYCELCIDTWQQSSHLSYSPCKCPMCRADLIDIVKIYPPAEVSSAAATAEAATAEAATAAEAAAYSENAIESQDIPLEKNGMNESTKDKLEMLEELLLTHLGEKIILFNNYSAIFGDVINMLDRLDISWTSLDGGSIAELDATVEKYKTGPSRVLLTNSSFYGCGMNLENTTDIVIMHKCAGKYTTSEGMESQIIGRAQRPGRDSALNVWMLMHSNESVAPHIFRQRPICLENNNTYIE